jgi:ribosomal protein S18 acetylase RimI-like enzyme
VAGGTVVELVDRPDNAHVKGAARLWRATEQDRTVEASVDYLDDQEQGFVDAIDQVGGWLTVAIHEGRVVGCVAGFPSHNEHAHDTAYLAYVAVEPTYRRRRIGHQLVMRAEARARGLGSTRMTLTVHDANAAARALYEGAGWQMTGATQIAPIGNELLVEYARQL